MRGTPRGVRIQGADGLMVRYAQCCQPVPGDAVVGYVTRGRGVSIHRADCPNLLLLAHEPERRLEIDWQEQAGERFLVRLALEGIDRRGLYADVAAAVSATGTDIRSLELRVGRRAGHGGRPGRGREPRPPAEDHEGGAARERDPRGRAAGAHRVATSERTPQPTRAVGGVAVSRTNPGIFDYIRVPCRAPNSDLHPPSSPPATSPSAIAELTAGLARGDRFQTLLGVTGSGKTMTMAHVIANHGRPTLVLSHNKTLAAQLYGELKSFFPTNAVEYFISYYDYYQPEAYVPSTDTYIEKDASINEDIDRLRLRATSSLMERDDVVIVATVSAIYGLGDPVEYRKQMVTLQKGQRIARESDPAPAREHPVLAQRRGIRARHVPRTRRHGRDLSGLRGAGRSRRALGRRDRAHLEDQPRSPARRSRCSSARGIYPAKHFITTRPTLERAVGSIRAELADRLAVLRNAGKLLEAQRLESRTNFDIEMMLEIGTCAGIENYSRPLSGRGAGERPACLLDYFPPDFLVVVDESHVTLPQVRGMYNGDRARKETLVEYGFRLPSALDNRPLIFDEFLSLMPRAMFVSATPADLELQLSEGVVVEQIIRPTGLVDPEIEVRPVRGQVDDLLNEIRIRERRGERVLVTTLTKRMAEDLTDYLQQMGVRVRYMHSDIDAIERMEIVRGLRLGEFDVLVGINLLREGLDMPEVSLVAILDADQEGFLRSDRSLIQTVGRAARHVSGRAIFYADRMTGLDEALHRRDRSAAAQSRCNTTRTTASRRAAS